MNPNPFDILDASRTDALELGDPNANLIFLATSDAAGQPSVRTLILEHIAERSLLILINRLQPKWADLQATGKYEVLLWYPLLQHQYRLRGTLREASPATLRTTWQRRPTPHKLADLAYSEAWRPSAPINAIDDFRAEVEAARTRYPDNPPRENASKHSVAVWLEATAVEVLLGSVADRLHDRRLYEWQHGAWASHALIP